MFRKIQTKSIRERRRKKIIDTIILGLSLFGACVLLLSQLSMLPVFRIDTIAIQGAGNISKSTLRADMFNEMKSFYLGLFSKRNILLYPSDSMEDVLLDNFKRIESIDIDVRGLKKIKVAIQERDAVALVQNMKDTFLVDETGFVFDEAGIADDMFIFLVSGEHSPIGTNILEGAMFIQTMSFLTELDQLVPIVSIHIVKDDRYDVTTKAGWNIIYDPHDDYDVLQENLQLAMQSENFDAGTVLYVDLRFGNRVFFK